MEDTAHQTQKEETKEKRRFERYDLFLPVHFNITNDQGTALSKKKIEGFTRNFSKEGMLFEFTAPELILSTEELINTVIKGDVVLPVVDRPITFSGEIKWARKLGPSRYFVGIFISYIDDFQKIQLLHFARRVNRSMNIIMSLIFTLTICVTVTIMMVFSFNTYIDKLTNRNKQIIQELSDTVDLLKGKLSEMAKQLEKK